MVKIFIGLLIAAAVAAGFFMLTRSSDGTSRWDQESERKIESNPAYKEGVEPELEVSGGSMLYRNAKYNFKLVHPAELQVTETENNGTFTVVFANSDATEAFQIFITPYAGWFVSEERIAMDIPSGKIENPVDVLIDGVKGTIFFSEHAAVGETREVWFLHGDYLYEVTAPKLLDEWLSHIMTTWRFLRAPENTVIWR